MKKILLVTSTFYPQNKVSVLRVGEWSKYLAKYGYEVTVLTPKKYSFLGPFGLNKKLPDNVIIKEVDFLPDVLKKKLDKKVNTIVYANNESNIYSLKLFVRKLRRYIGSLIDIHDLWIKPALKEAIKLHEQKKFDYIISSFSPPAVHIIAHKLKIHYPSVKWIADFRDLWAYNHILNPRGIFKIYEKYRESKVLSNSDCIVTVSKPLSDLMKEAYPEKNVFTIENGFDPEEFPNWKENIVKFPEIKDKLTISYLGTIYPEKRDPSILFESINELIEEGFLSKDRVEINFYGDNKKQLLEIINPKNLNKFGIINIKGFVSREESLKIQKNSDLLLLLEWNDPSAKGVLTGKLFEYLVSGRPILAIGISNENAAGEVIEKTKTGKLFLEKESLKNELKKIFVNQKIEFYDPLIEEIEKFSRKKQVEKLIRIMDGL